MTCKFTLPEGNIRYRVYKCKFCKKDFRTLEVPAKMAGKSLAGLVRQFECRRYAFYKALMAGK